MSGIPDGLDLSALPGLVRGEYPAADYRDEIVWSPSGTNFALAYTIIESSNNCEVGSVAWGTVETGTAKILGVLKLKQYACCWFHPWCQWLDDDRFIFKSYRYSHPNLRFPLTVVHTNGRHFNLFGTNKLNLSPFKISGIIRLQLKLRSTLAT